MYLDIKFRYINENVSKNLGVEGGGRTEEYTYGLVQECTIDCPHDATNVVVDQGAHTRLHAGTQRCV